MIDFLENIPDQTPLDPDELKDLLPDHIRTQKNLNEFEAANIEQAIKKHLFAKRRHDFSNPEVLKRIHRDMFNQTWKWAGEYRRSSKNLGKDWWMIPEEVKKVCDDLKYWQENKTFTPIEIAIRFHHRLVVIHPFSNGNGRHARLVANILIHEMGQKIPTWGSVLLSDNNTDRNAYIKALRKADEGDFEELIRFAVS